MRLITAVALALCALALALVGPAPAREAATCTAKQKRAAQKALAAYRMAMPKRRAAYFRTHKRPAQRKAFTKKQQRRVRALRRAAACTVVSPAQPPPPPPPPAPPPPPPPPADTTSPQLTTAAVNGATVTVRFSEDVVLAGPQFAVYVNGGARTIQAVAVAANAVVLTLGQPVEGADVAALDYGGGVGDAAGNPAPSALGVVAANATPAPCSFMVSNGGLGGPGALNEGATDLTLHAPGTGTLRGIVLWVDFPDAPGSESLAALSDSIFEPASAAYAAMSYGRLTLEIAASARWYRLPQPSTYYGLRSADSPGRKDEYIAAAIQAANADVDFSRFDVVYLVPAAGAAADFATGTQRPHGAGLATVDGKEIRFAVLLGTEPIAREPDAVVHETGHVLGLPDLYADLTAVGGWDPMSFPTRPGPEFIAWHRWKLGWLEPEQLRCTDPGRTIEATLAPLGTVGGVKAVVAPLGSTRALVVENRQPVGLDSGLCDKGVLVYTVDGTVVWPGAPVRVAPASPGTDTDEEKRQRCGPRYDAPLDLGPGEVSSYHDAATGVRVDLISATDRDYVVRVSR